MPSTLWDIPVAASLLTRLPLPRVPEAAFDDQARAAWAYPLVGVVVGGLAAMVGALSAGLAPGIAAGLTLATLLMLTGGLHEDGLADTADGLWGGPTPERRLEIMKDSRIGAYGVLALILVLGLRWLGLAQVGWADVIVAAAASRAFMPVLMAALPHARSTGLSHHVGRPTAVNAGIGLLIAAVFAVVLSGGAGLLAMTIAVLIAFALARTARSKIGGQTGDILGAAQVLTEVAILIALSA
ncbi:MAG: adenosylcobinamide-GDP ribazoletransferase [Pseudomonadota bacterium]